MLSAQWWEIQDRLRLTLVTKEVFLFISRNLWLSEKVNKERSRDPCSHGISKHLSIVVHHDGRERRQGPQSSQWDFKEFWLEKVQKWGWMMGLGQHTESADVRQVHRHQGEGWPQCGGSRRAGEGCSKAGKYGRW